MSGSLDTEVESLTYDSRKAKAESRVLHLRGSKTDGHDFTGKALEQGASAIVAEIAPPDDCKRLCGCM